MVRNVTTPTLTLFLPDAASATGIAVIVCPGGGFRFLSWQNEGTAVAEWLQKRGVAAFVVKCRLKETPASAEELRKELGLFSSILSALRTETSRATRPSNLPRICERAEPQPLLMDANL